MKGCVGVRVSKSERRANALRFYRRLRNSGKAAIVIERTQSTVEGMYRCKFLAVLSGFGEPEVLAESREGIEGCFAELLGFIKDCPQKKFFEQNFNTWLRQTYGIEITYVDGVVMLLESLLWG